MRSQNEMKHGLAKKIFLYSIMMTLLFTGYESYRDTVMKAKERIQSGFYTIFTSVKAKLQNTVAQNDHQKSSSDNHWPVVGWPVEKLSTASEVKYLSSLDCFFGQSMSRSRPAATEGVRPTLPGTAARQTQWTGAHILGR